MNFRVFRTVVDLRDTLVSEIVRVTSPSPAPYIGVIGSPSASGWLLERVAVISRLVIAGYPAELDELIRSRPDLAPASREDLIEPLDLAVVVGESRDEWPDWLPDARGILIAPDGSVGAWARQSETMTDRAWTFILEEQWRTWQSIQKEEDA